MENMLTEWEGQSRGSRSCHRYPCVENQHHNFLFIFFLIFFLYFIYFYFFLTFLIFCFHFFSILDPPTLEVGPINSPMSVRASVRGFSQKPVMESFWNLTWSYRIIVVKMWRSRIFEKNSRSWEFGQNGPKMAQKWGYWTLVQNLIIKCHMILCLSDRYHNNALFCKNRMFGKILVLDLWPKMV